MREVHFQHLAFAFGAWKGAPYMRSIGPFRPPNSSSQETTMKVIASALIALSLLTGIASTASAFDAKTFYEQQDAASH